MEESIESALEMLSTVWLLTIRRPLTAALYTVTMDGPRRFSNEGR